MFLTYWLYVPKGKDPKNLPVMIEIHGGPEAQQKSNFDELIAYIVSEGIAVVAPNVRGSTGYGKTYTHLDDVEKRLDSVKDIESLVKHLVDSGVADKDKIAVSGTSYGGFMTLSCAARYPDLFCAAVDTVGMYNLVTFLERTAAYRRAHRESEYGSLEFDRETLFNVSPVAKVDDIKGPLMIVHGTNDPRVPVFEAQQVHEYLSNKGVEVKFLEYQDEGHGIHKIENKLDCYPKVVAFLKDKMQIEKEN
ncbi:MAG: S9 family peptidase [Erysipelothrix sp.]|nr:S9 family peptidase [Erysipelothrix sp.]